MDLGPELQRSEIERMRSILMEHDRKVNTSAYTVIDISKPPVKPYVYNKFPMLVYDPQSNQPAHSVTITNLLGQGDTQHIPWKCETRIVNGEEELAAAIKDGWSEKAPEERYSKPVRKKATQ